MLDCCLTKKTRPHYTATISSNNINKSSPQTVEAHSMDHFKHKLQAKLISTIAVYFSINTDEAPLKIGIQFEFQEPLTAPRNFNATLSVKESSRVLDSALTTFKIPENNKLLASHITDALLSKQELQLKITDRTNNIGLLSVKTAPGLISAPGNTYLPRTASTATLATQGSGSTHTGRRRSVANN